MPQAIDPMRIFMVGRLALLSGDLATAAAAMEWACRLDPSSPVFRQAAQSVIRRRDRRQATAVLYREAMETAEEIFGHAHPLVAYIADGFAEHCEWLAQRGASRDRCRLALAGSGAGGPSVGTSQGEPPADPLDDTGSGHMSGLARYIHDMIDLQTAED